MKHTISIGNWSLILKNTGYLLQKINLLQNKHTLFLFCSFCDKLELSNMTEKVVTEVSVYNTSTLTRVLSENLIYNTDLQVWVTSQI